MILVIVEENIGLARAADTNQSLKLYYYNDAAIACHHGLSVIKEANCNNNAELQKLENKICRSLNDIQIDMVSVCGGRLELLQNIDNKANLSNISNYGVIAQLRAEIRDQLKSIEAAKTNKEKAVYIELTANIFKQVASGIEHYLAELYRDAEAILGLPPCNYTVIGLGSIALRQITPYSDLEFAILTENEDYQQSEDFRVREYFKNLTHLVHFKVINLGETVMPISSYGFDFKDLVKVAVNFDLGGKTPLGRVDKSYELIQTADGMLGYLQNPDKTTDHIDKNLASILQKACFIYGNKELAKSYQDQAQDFLLARNDKGRPNHEERGIKALSEGVEEIDYTKQIPQVHQTSGNLKQFAFNSETQDVKQEIYRIPDKFIYNLGLIYGMQEDSNWDTIDKLCERGIINAEGAANLKRALSFATNLRLKTYSHYGYQKDTMDFAKTYDVQSNEIEKELTTVFKLIDEDLKGDDSALFEYYYTTLALREKIKEFCKLDDLNQKEGFFCNNSFYQNDVGIKAQINLRLLRYEEALKYQLEELETLKSKYAENNHSDVAKSLDNIAITYGELGNHKDALNYHTQALEILKKSLGNDHPYVARSLYNIGITYGELGNHKDALRYQIKALEIWRKSLGDDHPYVADSLKNIGTTYGELGKHKEALEYQKKALEIRKNTLDNDPPDIATSYNNIGSTYENLGEHVKALEHMTRALEILQKSLGNNHPDVAKNLNNIAITYGNLGEHVKALQYQKKTLEIFQKSLGDDHLDIAISYNNIGATYGALNNHKEALEYQKKALEILQKSLGNDHPNIATSYNNIGATYGELGEHVKALEYQKKALEIFQKSLGSDHPNIATSYNNIGTTYGELGNHKDALNYHTQALEIFQKSLGNDHPETIICKHNVSLTYCNLSMYNNALAELAGILAVCKKASQQDKIVQYSNEIAYIKSIKSTYEDASQLLNNTTVQAKNSKEIAKVLSNLNIALNQFKKCNNFEKSDVIDKKILQTLDLLVKAQTSLHQNSKKNKLETRKILNSYQKEYETLKKSIDDKQLKLREVEEYLAAQKQIQDEQSEMELDKKESQISNKPLSMGAKSVIINYPHTDIEPSSNISTYDIRIPELNSEISTVANLQSSTSEQVNTTLVEYNIVDRLATTTILSEDLETPPQTENKSFTEENPQTVLEAAPNLQSNEEASSKINEDNISAISSTHSSGLKDESQQEIIHNFPQFNHQLTKDNHLEKENTSKPSKQREFNLKVMANDIAQLKQSNISDITGFVEEYIDTYKQQSEISVPIGFGLILNSTIALNETELALKIIDEIELGLVLKEFSSSDIVDIMTCVDGSGYSVASTTLYSGNQKLFDALSNLIQNLDQEKIIKTECISKDLRHLETIIRCPQFEEFDAKECIESFIKPLYLETSIIGVTSLIENT